VVVALGAAWATSYRRQTEKINGLAVELRSQESIDLILKSGLEAERSPPFAGLPKPSAPNPDLKSN
jgi:hypothetical protein